MTCSVVCSRIICIFIYFFWISSIYDHVIFLDLNKTLNNLTPMRMCIYFHTDMLTYGAETWEIRNTDENRFLSFERKILRKMFGPVKNSVTNEWTIRKNDELELLYQKPNIVEAIRNKKLQWTGHAWKNQNSLLRIVLEKNPTGKIPIGRPKMRWEDVVKKNVEELGGRSDWKAWATDREGWKAGCMMGWCMKAENTQKKKTL